jgi:hypothetical protein
MNFVTKVRQRLKRKFCKHEYQQTAVKMQPGGACVLEFTCIHCGGKVYSAIA